MNQQPSQREISIGHQHLQTLRRSLRQLRIRHWPFQKLEDTYKIRILDSPAVVLLILALSETDFTLDSG